MTDDNGIPTTYIAVDGLAPDELSDVAVSELGQAVREYVKEEHAPDRLYVYVSETPIDCDE
jgi:hypothetical protein